MPKPRRKLLVPNPRVLEDFRQAATQPIPSDSVTVQWIIKGLLYRISQSTSQEEANYVRMVIRGFTALEKSPLARDSKMFELLRFAWLSMLFEGVPKSSHRLHTLQVQKSLLIDRLEQFERSKQNNTALWLQEEGGKIIQELTAFPCYCNYATSLQEILAPPRSTPSRKDFKPICNTYHGIKLVHLILGILHHLAPTSIETLLKMSIKEETHHPNFDRLLKLMEDALSRN